MKRKRIICLLLFIVFILVFSACHPRHVSDIKQNMTKEEVASLWGRTPLITYRTVNGKAVETWEYYFSSTDSICWVTFSQDKVAGTQCRSVRGERIGLIHSRGRAKRDLLQLDRIWCGRVLLQWSWLRC
jgi:hypothetical protein